ncbi:TPA: hypothetical protein QCH58_001919 [Enterobacter asburiae]|nr:hypothetical protein [Enterobacter asburiae]
MLTLIVTQPWLGDKVDVLGQLLYDECQDAETRELLIELINRFEYLNQDRYHLLMDEISTEIVSDPSLYQQSTLISAMSIGHNADSGQAILYSLKVLLQKLKWTKHLLVNDAMHALKTFKRNPQLKDIILVDEFVGSGKTVIDRVKTIKTQFKNDNIDDFTIQVKVLASTKQGLLKIREQGIKITSQLVLNRGISDYYSSPIAEEKIDRMLELEKILSAEYNGRERPSLGYGKAEALYYRENTNLPNSVFPIFWWAEYLNKKERETLLFRSMGDA